MDFSSPTAIARTLIPKIPFLVGTALYHLLNLSPTSTTWDLKTELVIHLIRTLLDSPHPRPLLVQQTASLRDPGIKGRIYISKITIPSPPTSDVLNLLTTAIDSLALSPSETYTPPTYSSGLYAEWTAYNPSATSSTTRPPLSEQTHYQNLTSTLSTSATILYLHGGAFYLMDPATHRLPTARLARLTSSRCLSLRYRLAPQNPFPSALLDTLIAYLSLLHPPPNSYHTPVPPNQIVLAGDSAGANLALSLVQLLLTINRTAKPGQTITFHDHKISLHLPLPAGAALNSPWLDLTRSLPSITSNAQFDYLPPPITPAQIARFPADSIWPTTPPRGDLYCNTSMLCHPLVSPLAARDWRGVCPVWFGVGEEMLADEDKCVASIIARQNQGEKGKVVWRQWGGMCHCFAMILVWTPASKKYFEEWAGFMKMVVGEEGGLVDGGGKFFEAKTGKERDVDLEELAVFGEEEVRERMEGCAKAREEGREGEAKILPRL